ncbi:transcription initiation factor IIF, beta subunit-domain-containing protein [Tuber borchii]|uniref:Transcription initiation factor IIF subunit beta n=1 Tax=Tuber borchii TaxID=42251 RepID=A0A2T7A9C4_TUBBO|nr:transcription initiation factor IIF, beta subunit-domain-containing protein [Tuber borchii]
MEQFSTLETFLAPQGNSNHQPQSSPYQASRKRELGDDDSQYESDPCELMLPENSDGGGGQSTAWLVKLPPYLTKHWKELLEFDDNEEIVLGTIRVNTPKAPNDKPEMRLRLNPSLKASRNIPQDYSLESRGKPHNIYCWTEEEEKVVPNKQAGPPMPIAFIERSRKRHRDSGTPGEPKETTFRRPPKANKTSFVTKFRDDLVATPVRMEGTPTLCARPEAVKKQLRYSVITPVNAQMNLLRPGTVGELPNRKGKELLFTAAAPAYKAYRMSKNDLISSLYELFESREYWYLKEFREKLSQPESYLKQVLKEIATYNQDGPMAGSWVLNSDSKEALEWMKAQKNGN